MAKFKKFELLLGKGVYYLLCCEVIYDCNISDILDLVILTFIIGIYLNN